MPRLRFLRQVGAVALTSLHERCLKSRNREIAPTVKRRDSEIPPTGELNDPTHFELRDRYQACKMLQ